MIFLFDDELGESHKAELSSWGVAEEFAEDMGWKLIGQFVSEVEEDTGEETYLQ